MKAQSLIIAAVLALVAPEAALAQRGVGGIAGVVKDTSGAVLP